MLGGRRSVPSASLVRNGGTVERRNSGERMRDRRTTTMGQFGRCQPAGPRTARPCCGRVCRATPRTVWPFGPAYSRDSWRMCYGVTMSTRLTWLPNPYLSSSIVAAATASSKESPFLRDSPAQPTQAQGPQCQGRSNLALPRGAPRSRRPQRRNGPASLPVVAVWTKILACRDKSYSGHLCSKCSR